MLVDTYLIFMFELKYGRHTALVCRLNKQGCDEISDVDPHWSYADHKIWSMRIRIQDNKISKFISNLLKVEMKKNIFKFVPKP